VPEKPAHAVIRATTLASASRFFMGAPFHKEEQCPAAGQRPV
jgi:hypothetical protein